MDMTKMIDLDYLARLESLHLIAPDAMDFSSPVAEALTRKYYDESRTAMPSLITEIRRLLEYIALLEQATGTMIQVKRGVFEPSSVFSRSECVFKYCMCPALCQEQCMLTKRGATK